MKTIDDIMATGEALSVVQINTCVREMLEIMDNKKLGTVCVTEDDILVGIITDGDLRRLILKTQDTLPKLFMKLANDIMVQSPKTVHPKTPVDECLQLLMQNRFWVVPVVNENNRLMGMVHMHDLIKEKMSSNE